MVPEITAALVTLTEYGMAKSARLAMEEAGLVCGEYDGDVEAAIVRALRWTVAEVRNLPVNEFVGAVTADGGRGLRDEVWHEFDMVRDDIDADLRLLILLCRGRDFETCTVDEHSDASDASDLLVEDAAEFLFAPVVAAVKAIYHRPMT
jgi:hypothetical protein